MFARDFDPPSGSPRIVGLVLAESLHISMRSGNGRETFSRMLIPWPRPVTFYGRVRGRSELLRLQWLKGALVFALIWICMTTAVCARAGSASSILPNAWPSFLNPNNWPGRLNPQTWPFTLIPIPFVATDPNAGTTYGILPVMLFTDKNNQINDIIAPDLTENSTLGPGGDFRFLAYPSADTQWYVMGGLTQKIARNADIEYATGRTHQDQWSFTGRFFFERDPTERFFGIGNNTPFGHQTNYTTEQVFATFMLGYNFTPRLQLAVTEEPRYVRLFNGAFGSVPSLFKLFPHVNGINGGTEFVNQAMLTYDNRDSIDIPTDGGIALLFGSITDRHLLSSGSYDKFGGELRHYFPIGRKLTLAGHFFMQYTPAGNETPFWSMARLGGEDSLLTDQQTLRGYGAGRFVDNNLLDMNVELRARVFDTDLFGTHGILELAPFLEAGRVFHSVNENPFGSLHKVGGIGFRGIALPFVVGYVDVGWGSEGAAVFSGINYPF